MAPDPPTGPPDPPPGESLAERVQRDGPLDAAAAWSVARQLLDALATRHAAAGTGDPDAAREDLRRLGATLWFTLTGDEPEFPLPWQRLERAGITPDLGALPVLLARTLTGEAAQRPANAVELRETLNMLAALRPDMTVWPDMPSRAPEPGSAVPTPDARPPMPEDRELWTRPTARLAASNRRRRDSTQIWNTLILLAVGGLAGFFGGVLYEKSYGPAARLASAPAPAAAPAATAAPPEPEAPLPPSPSVTAPAVAARLDRVKNLQPEVADVLKYARELRRIATLPVADGVPFPSDAAMGQLLERFDWKNPASPYFHRTPLLVALGYSNDDSDAQSQATSRRLADFLAQALVASKVTSPIYACAMGSGDEVPEVEKGAAGSGRFVEVWVGWTLF